MRSRTKPREGTIRNPTEFTRAQRFGLIVLATAGLVGVNGVFLYGAFFRPGAYEAATSNPVAVAFMVEAALLVVALAWLFERWRVSRIGWVGFVLLALVGSLAFAVPVALLFPEERWRRPGPPRSPRC